MLTLYIITAIVGGAMVLISAFAGGHDTDADVDHSLDHAHDIDSSFDSDHGGDHDADHAGPWLPFFSMRFWTFLLGTFGVTGTALSLLTDTPSPIVLTWAIALGLVMGLAVSFLMRALKLTSADSSVAQNDFLGVEALVTVPIRGALMGRVRVNVKGEDLDLHATSQGEDTHSEGDKVVIVEMVDGKAKVVPREDLFGKETQW